MVFEHYPLPSQIVRFLLKRLIAQFSPFSVFIY